MLTSKLIAGNDPHWYVVTAHIINGLSDDIDSFKKFINEGLDKSPNYYQLYFSAINYLAPKWHGDKLQIEIFANQAVKRTKSVEGMGMYARIYWYASQTQYDDRLFLDSDVVWGKMREGIYDVIKKYPASWNIQNFAYFSCLAKDKETTRMLLDKMSKPMIKRVWKKREYYNYCRSFAYPVLPPKKMAVSLTDVVINQEMFSNYVSKTYDFSPQTLFQTEREKKSKTLDEFWSDVKKKKIEYLPMLRKELELDTHMPFFYYDGALLLLSLSETKEDKNLFLRSIVKSDLADIQHTDYLFRVHKLAVGGYDTSDAAIHILGYSNFKAYIPIHFLTLEQDFSLIYMLLPTQESFYLDKLIARLSVEKEVVALKSVLLCIWYTVTEKGNLAIESFIKRASQKPEIAKYANELLERNNDVPKQNNSRSYDSIKEKRKKSLTRISDEALYELNDYTKDLIGKLN